MKKMALHWRVALVGVAPLIAFLGLVLLTSAQHYESYAEASKTIEMLKESSNVLDIESDSSELADASRKLPGSEASLDALREQAYFAKQKAKKSLTLYIAIGCSLSLLFAILIWYSANRLSSRLREIAGKLKTGTNEFSSASIQIYKSSESLSDASTQQAASLQETVASAEEINAMVNRNASSAKRSMDTASKSTRSVQNAQETVQDMVKAIDDISESNDQVLHQMNEGNKKISEIVQVIKEISDKTQIINDIVFQTKLLSFNASVEAARAGEHGKGFAVVAEEVGNLASMSGNAANEISEMLNESIQKVEKIVVETKSKVGQTVKSSTTSMDAGKRVAENCRKALSEISEQVSSVSQAVAEISEASSEQAQGVQEITESMSQLDQVTQSNASTAQKTSAFSENLKKQSREVDFLVRELMGLVGGRDARRAVQQVEVETPKPKRPKVEKTLKFPVKKDKKVVHTVVEKAEPAVEKVAIGQITVPSWDDPGFEDL